MTAIIRRADWGARHPRSRRTITLPTSEVWLHHFATEKWFGAEGMRACQRYHMDSKGWADIGYSFVVDPTSLEVYEGRGAGVSGAHTYGHNTKSHGIAVMGNFQSREVSSMLIDRIAGLLAYGKKQGWWGGALSGGHRDVVGTQCPGDNLYAAIASINARAKNLAQPPIPTMAQAVVTDSNVERLAGEVLARAYYWAHVHPVDGGKFVRRDTGEEVKVDFAITLGGEPRSYSDLHITGPDRYATARAVGDLIRKFPPGTEVRRGHPFE